MLVSLGLLALVWALYLGKTFYKAVYLMAKKIGISGINDPILKVAFLVMEVRN